MAESTLESATIDQLVFKLALAIGGYPENKDKKPIIDLATSLDNSKVHGKKQKTKDELIVLNQLKKHWGWTTRITRRKRNDH